MCAILGAAANAAFAMVGNGLAGALLLRFATGVSLAGVYPAGMKLIVRWALAGSGYRSQTNVEHTVRARS